ncbi:response regulator [Haloferula sp. BvORR071]|uniref:response regulator transcription factor n=1 Tax=Haloferula sp. BvORR071 TaxID=1396141 RepID=UPI00055553B8|nr:response regulator [Haloferula sp. BvORR071]
MATGQSTIYIIDDDASVRRALMRVMTQAGLPCKAFESSEAFLAVAAQGDKGCIVADMTMPGISGLELKTLLDSGGFQLSLVLLTAQDTDATRTAARNAGAAAYFRKPVDIQALLDAVRWACCPTSAEPGAFT